jgi:protein gp37
MSGTTSIEWADKVWNPVTGCNKVSQGCKNCYAKTLHDMRHKAYLAGAKLPKQYAVPFETVQLHPDRLDDPLHWRKPARIFVNSMSDLFHPNVPDEFIDEIFGIMELCTWHTFMVLTKRPERMLKLTKGTESFFPENVWLGVSVEDQKAADERIPLLLQTPAEVRFVSCEPLLGEVDLNIGVCPECGGCGETSWHYFQDDGMDTCDACGGNGTAVDKLDWVIVGGESGPGARPMHPKWALDIRNQCVEAGVPLFFKQWGEWKLIRDAGEDPMPENERLWERVGKKAAGRLLGGREWSDFPKVRVRE